MIKTYASEANIADLITSNTSIAYQHEMSPLSCDIAVQEKIKAGLLDNITVGVQNAIPIIAGEKDTDLHYVQSVLVTTNWNKNDDVFDIQEVWYARNTPTHKPTNIGHDEHEIVGHMTANWAIGEDGKIIPDTTKTEDLPDMFHVVNGSVIYKSWQDNKLLNRALQLIDDIDNGRKFVSMECMFTGFDYAVLSSDGKSHTIARSDQTSFLTKHLRAYGGSGLYNGMPIGRMLRNITFTGKGFVDKPANPNSIIFDKDKYFNFADANENIDEVVFATELEQSEQLDNLEILDESSSFNKNGVCNTLDTKLNNEEKLMTDFLHKENVELKAAIEELRAQLAKSNVEQLETTIATLTDEAAVATTRFDELQSQIDVQATEVKSVTESLVEIKAERDALQINLDAVKAKELRTNRVSSLVDGGIDKEIAEQKVELYASLSDEQFADLSNELIEASKAQKIQVVDQPVDETIKDSEVVEADTTDVPDNVSDEEKDEAEAEAEADILDEVEQDTDIVVDLATEAHIQEDNDVRTKLSRALAGFLGIADDSNKETE